MTCSMKDEDEVRNGEDEAVNGETISLQKQKHGGLAEHG